MIQISSSYYFSNVKLLRLENDFISAFHQKKEHLFDIEHIQNLKEFFSLLKINGLFICSKYKFKCSSVIIQLLNERTNISIIRIDLQLSKVFYLQQINNFRY